jgi:carbonic anhydrase
MRASSTLIALLIVAAGAVPIGAQAQTSNYSHYGSPWKTPWDYPGPRGAAHWSSLDPTYALCNAGVAAFARLFPDDGRPLQPLNGRVVEENK